MTNTQHLIFCFLGFCIFLLPVILFFVRDCLALRKIKRRHRDELLEIKRRMDEILEAARKKS